MDEENLLFNVDEEKAKELARRFLSQYYTVVDTKAALVKQVWVVKTYLGFANTQMKQVRIDANSGKILGYT